MAISSSSTGLRPGVCTSTTRPTTPYTGMLIYETDTGYLRVWDGSAWDYLSQSQNDTVGLGPVGGMILVKTQTIGTAVSSVTVSDAFNSTFDNYKILVTGGSYSTTADLGIKFGASSNYRFQYIYGTLSSSLAGAGSVGSSNFPYVGVGGATGIFADISVVAPFLSTSTFVTAHAGRAGNYMGTFSGILTDTTSFTSFTLEPNAGTITGGTIRVYGYRNS